jgi:parvulin-like peptidyl-prolyl isomerase
MTSSREPNNNTPGHGAKKRNQVNVQSVHPPKPVQKTPSRAEKKEAQAIAATPSPTAKKSGRTKLILGISGIVLVIALIAGIVYYVMAVVPMQRPILTVGTEDITTGYFLKRVVANPGADINSAIQGMEAELIIKQQAASYGVTAVTAQDIDTYMRDQAKASNSTISDADFNTWLKQQLDNTGLSAAEFRDVMSREIQRQRLTDILAQGMPSDAPQVHLWAMKFNSNSAALTAKARIDSGTDFATVANTLGGQTNGGDMGWTITSFLPTEISSGISKLDIGKVSDPVAYSTSSTSTASGKVTYYYLLKVTEKDDAKQLSDDEITAVKSQVLYNWLTKELSAAKITIHGLNGSTTLDAQTSTWLNYQAQKLMKKRPTETTPTGTVTTTTGTITTTGAKP